MWRRKPKFKEIDDMAVKRLTYKLPGVDNSKIMQVDGGIRGKLYLWGFVADKYQPKSIPEIWYEYYRELDRKKNNQ